MSFLIQQEIIEGNGLLLTINRPEVYNALCYPLLTELKELVFQLYHSNLRIMIITGAGTKAFCSGADLKERDSMNDDQVLQFIDTIRDTFQLIANLPFPVIAAINGVAFGGGLELALACDLRLASEQAMLGLTEVALGIIPGAGGTQRLARIIGPARAKELIFTAARFTAREGEKIGLINHVYKPEDLLPNALGLAERIAQHGPLAVRQAKTAINRGLNMSLDDALYWETSCYRQLINTADRREGLTAFKEKRLPQFQGK
ncbi:MULTISPECIES: enoyl-CoA hydratase-related protein [Carboxydocella]|uniref:short-chain-enoyl-CoA hydratase n=2 Tax=Carboxydocella TaxID=178898 RepID=A0A1T4LV93_9FIRM|nr:MULTISPECIES: enoyl-CoA hydratase-related protein [Carboxydocella]AVX20627.1 short chain enoyl-CoA hydratase [Carboxydocella thermautotrophica]AVX31049.1 short chain enoyl-CoA hydratase [Carboxydocella thermautotrophica]SJZ58556.1 short chain enoyl-CoA hydratase [Carboxydocella sporoproducens DSM 16521]GAW27949.1 enoyl-CoA hydratase [Carboxydocella sp. ULO1]GAW31555.1 enoyl-CoA hydratase [Carboxydocella sp. JDF658]